MADTRNSTTVLNFVQFLDIRDTDGYRVEVEVVQVATFKSLEYDRVLFLKITDPKRKLRSSKQISFKHDYFELGAAF